jgi:hypothetical protein
VTDVTWDPAGNIFISDGYINSRVADRQERQLGVVGARGDKPGEFNTPHSIAPTRKAASTSPTASASASGVRRRRQVPAR